MNKIHDPPAISTLGVPGEENCSEVDALGDVLDLVLLRLPRHDRGAVVYERVR